MMPALEDVLPNSEKRFRNRGSFDEGDYLRLFDAGAFRHGNIFSITTARNQGHNGVAKREALCAIA